MEDAGRPRVRERCNRRMGGRVVLSCRPTGLPACAWLGDGWDGGVDDVGCLLRLADARALRVGISQDEPHIQVKSEEESDRVLLNTKIIKDDGYQKQQGEFREEDLNWIFKKVEGNY